MTAAATIETTEVAPKAGGRKKLVILVAAAVLVLALIGVAVAVVLKKRSVTSEGEDGEAHVPAAAEVVKAELKTGAPPVFLPLEPFTVNLADRDAERYAQLGVTLEIDDAKTGDQVKAYMPAIRNNVLMLLSSKSAAELLSHEGKLTLAREIRREALRPLGVVVKDEPAAGADAAKRKVRAPQIDYPIRAVHFSNLIVQ